MIETDVPLSRSSVEFLPSFVSPVGLPLSELTVARALPREFRRLPVFLLYGVAALAVLGAGAMGVRQLHDQYEYQVAIPTYDVGQTLIVRAPNNLRPISPGMTMADCEIAPDTSVIVRGHSDKAGLLVEVGERDRDTDPFFCRTGTVGFVADAPLAAGIWADTRPAIRAKREAQEEADKLGLR